jgi:hypothetical protein
VILTLVCFWFVCHTWPFQVFKHKELKLRVNKLSTYFEVKVFSDISVFSMMFCDNWLSLVLYLRLDPLVCFDNLHCNRLIYRCDLVDAQSMIAFMLQ